MNSFYSNAILIKKRDFFALPDHMRQNSSDGLKVQTIINGQPTMVLAIII